MQHRGMVRYVKGNRVRALGAPSLVAVSLLTACGQTVVSHATAPATPKPLPGHVVFADNFSSRRSGWRNDIVFGHGGYVKGGYALAGYAAERVRPIAVLVDEG